MTYLQSKYKINMHSGFYAQMMKFYTALNTPYQSVRGGTQFLALFKPPKRTPFLIITNVKCIIDQFGLLAINLDSIQRCSVRVVMSAYCHTSSVSSMLQRHSI